MKTKELIEVAWGKSNYNDEYDDYDWLPVWVHLLDTYVSSQLIYEWIPSNVIRILKEDLNLNDKGLKGLLGWFAVTHDLGKISPGFYTRDSVIWNTKPLYLRMTQTESINGKKINFNFANQYYSKPRHEAVTAYILEEIISKNNDIPKKQNKNLKRALTVSAGHHGSPTIKEFNDAKNLKLSLGADKYLIWQRMQSELYDFVNQTVFSDNDGEKALLSIIKNPVTSRSITLLTSLLIMSDWIASNQKNFPLLPYDTVFSLDNKDFINNRMAVNETYRDFNINKKFIPTKNTLPKNELMFNRFGFSPNTLQESVLDMLYQIYENSGADALRDCYIIEAPMGLGKTEAALIASEFINSKTEQSGIFFGLPTMATSNAMYDRLELYLRSYEKEHPDSQFSEILIHSKSNQTKTILSKFTKEYDNDYGLVPPNWFADMKHLKLMNNFIVGTVDQFLSMSLKMKYEYWKHLGFISKTIIIDEVHSLDGFMLGYLKKSLEWSGYYGIPVIITTATLNKNIKESLLNSYKKGKESAK